MSKDFFDRSKQYTQQHLDGEIRVVEIPEFGDESGPMKLYIHPLTFDEMEKICKSNGRFGEAVESLILRARDEQGKRMFSPAERTRIRNEVPPDIMLRLHQEINTDLVEILAAGLKSEGIDLAGK